MFPIYIQSLKCVCKLPHITYRYKRTLPCSLWDLAWILSQFYAFHLWMHFHQCDLQRWCMHNLPCNMWTWVCICPGLWVFMSRHPCASGVSGLMCSPLGRRSSTHSLLNCPSCGRRWDSLYKSPQLMTTNPSLLRKKWERERKLGWESSALKCKQRWIESWGSRERRGETAKLEADINILMLGCYWPLPPCLCFFTSLFSIAAARTSHPCPLSFVSSCRDQCEGNGLWMH